MKLYASIYIGSYEIILKVFQITQKKRLKELDCLRTPIDTAQDIYASGQLKKETVDRICNVLEDMKLHHCPVSADRRTIRSMPALPLRRQTTASWPWNRSNCAPV